MRIATPCHETWNAMTLAGGGRHCATCDQTVVDLTGLPVDERRQRLAALGTAVAGGRRVCVRGRIDRDGALAGSRRVLTAGMAALLAMTIAGCAGDGPAVQAHTPPPTGQQAPLTGEAQLPPAHRTLMGDVCAPPPMGKIAAPAPRPAPADEPHSAR